ncbi:MAG: 30S ribosomal protein S12 methylthiotransferase RimO [Peptococcaceae bacterium]|nr:30S ribosomal protein S12 methylthiotransferase RimO [Peptococcaceae bacterium]
MKKVAVINLGCPKNQVDSEVIRGILADKYCITSDPTEANIIIVNTCGFIQDAKEESIEAILEMTELKNDGPCEMVLAAGCLAQRYGKELLQEIPELDGVLGDGDLHTIPLVLENPGPGKIYTHKKCQDFLYSHNMPRIRLSPSYFAYVKIAEGCDNCCSYCAIPQIKGRYRSRPIESIVEEVRGLVQEGVKEIALVAQDTTRYGLDRYGEPILTLLLPKIAEIEGLEWIRLMYCYPDVFSEELIEIMATEPKLCKYIDLPLQHASNVILQKMKRRNTVEEAADLITRLRQKIPDIFIRSTFITGFPGETQEQFQELLDFVRFAKLDRVGVFTYSQEEGTAAAQMGDQISPEIKEARKEELLALQEEIALEVQQKRIGKVVRVILEEEISSQEWQGRTEGDAPEIDGQIYLKVTKKHLAGDIIKARILEADSFDFKGEELS